MASLDKKKVLIVGINYAPEHTGISPYTTQLARHLRSCGVSPTVFTGVPHYPDWVVPPKYRRRLSSTELIEDVFVVRLRHYVPRTQSALRRALYELTYGLQVVLRRNSVQPDVVVAVVPSLFGAIAAARISRIAGAPLVLWLQDLMGRATTESGIRGGALLARSTGAIEARLIRSATSVIAINDDFRSYVLSLGLDELQVEVIPNWSHIATPSESRSVVRQRLGWSEGQVIALHAGNMGLKQGLENVVEAARLSEKDSSPVKFVLLGDGSQKKLLRERAAAVNGVEFLAPASEQEYPNILSAADVLLVNERASVAGMSLPSKLTSYFRAGVPVVAAVSPGGITAIELSKSSGGVLVQPDDPAALLSAIRQLNCDKPRRDRITEAAARYARDWLRPEPALESITSILERSLSRPPRGEPSTNSAGPIVS